MNEIKPIKCYKICCIMGGRYYSSHESCFPVEYRLNQIALPPVGAANSLFGFLDVISATRYYNQLINSAMNNYALFFGWGYEKHYVSRTPTSFHYDFSFGFDVRENSFPNGTVLFRRIQLFRLIASNEHHTSR